ncbi:hypothetical protein LVQ78_21215 [Buttiauxella sp. A2-C2_NF]|jgi:hypothetical protein|uniref:hypothetical protein n=1 Tax=Buttiauxella TaxID=82976 RepID=UPI00105FEA87|nr:MULTISPECIES: hypothetical protein [Buttiauxella]MCE0828536.1 hypothetical protein [Buttiauxella ferragutiae]TDN55219.1 hypothetical protein EC843_1011285 [Buttiauxella sp. JUb87]
MAVNKILLALVPALSLLAAPALAQAEEECMAQLKTQAALLHPTSQLNESISACKVWPWAPDKTIMVMMLSAPDGEPDFTIYDVDVMVTDTQSGKVIARNTHPQAVQDDAIATSSVTIDTARYQLTPDLRAFAIRFVHTGSSNVNQFGVESLNMYVLKDKTLPLLVNHFSMVIDSGEWDGACTGYFTKNKRTISVLNTTSNGYADLRVHDKKVSNETNRDKAGKCAETKVGEEETDIILRFDGKVYPVDKKEQFDSAF